MQHYQNICFSNQKLTVFHLNITIVKNFDDKLFLKQLTWKLYNTSLFNLDGYDLIYNDGNLNKNDGVTVYVKNLLNYSSRIIHLANLKVVNLTLFIK